MIYLNDVMTNKKTKLETRDNNKAGIYVCGVTVYDRCHIGHLRSMLSFDAIIRYLEYKGYKVKYVRNFTDVEDKIIMRAGEIKAGLNGNWKDAPKYANFDEKDWEQRKRDDMAIKTESKASDKHLSLQVSEYFIQQFYQDLAPFGMRKPDIEPKVSEHIQQIIDLIQGIVDNGFAYVVEGNVYFDVPAYHKATKAYGKLSGRDYSQLMDGARVEKDKNKKNSVDFALWKAAKEGEPAWDSPWGKGRPGWHIECSAMSLHYLGNNFDIHGGGKDLIFPHHENEIAQSEGGTGEGFAKYWMHNGFVTVNGVKMSKSLGNFISLQDASDLALPEVWRYLILSSHYKSPIDFSFTKKDEQGEIQRGTVDIAAERLKYFYDTLVRVNKVLKNNDPIPASGKILDTDKAGNLMDKFEKAMDDDFNSAVAISHMGETAKYINELVSMKKKKLKKAGMDNWLKTLEVLRDELLKAGAVLGFLQQEPVQFQKKFISFVLDKKDLDPKWIESEIEKRKEAKKNRDYETADKIRDNLFANGIIIKDLPGKTVWDVRV
ncbi:MAG: cysteine--tRNA ligase [Myxococcota bacterium]